MGAGCSGENWEEAAGKVRVLWVMDEKGREEEDNIFLDFFFNFWTRKMYSMDLYF